MLIAVNTKQEYEAIKLIKQDNTYLDFVNNNQDTKQENKNNNKIIDANLSENILELATAENLFGEKNVYFVKVITVDQLELFNKVVIENCQMSENLFFFWGKVKLFTDKCVEYKIKLLEKKEIKKFDFPQSLVNALQKKDKKNTWQLYLKESENKNIEEVYGLFIWSYKQLMNVNSMSKYDDKSGLKEFQYKSIKLNLVERQKNLKKGINLKPDLENSYFDLVYLYGNSRKNSLDLKGGLERWILSW